MAGDSCTTLRGYVEVPKDARFQKDEWKTLTLDIQDVKPPDGVVLPSISKHPKPALLTVGELMFAFPPIEPNRAMLKERYLSSNCIGYHVI